ncbi:MAG: M20 metallopeptidase family protein [Ignavibacteriales bacterium]
MYRMFLEEATNIFDYMQAARQTLHKYPEAGLELYETCNFVQNCLKEMGIPSKNLNGKGVIADIGSGKKPIIALRADMDALEIAESSQVPYKSKVSGTMHACGHDAHTAILLGTAKVLKGMESTLKGTIRLIFQTGEEIAKGAKEMLANGALENVDAVIGMHVNPNLLVSEIGVNRKAAFAASSPFKIEVKGKGTHAATPEKGIDANFILDEIESSLQKIIARQISALDSALITIGKSNRGSARNALADKADAEGILRAVGEELRFFCMERMKSVVKLTAEMWGGEASICFEEGCPSLENNNFMVRAFKKFINTADNISLVEFENPSMMAEDFAYFSEKVPGLYYMLGCRNEEKGKTSDLHTGSFDVDEDCMVIGCALQCLIAYNYLLNF